MEEKLVMKHRVLKIHPADNVLNEQIILFSGNAA